MAKNRIHAQDRAGVIKRHDKLIRNAKSLINAVGVYTQIVRRDFNINIAPKLSN